MACLVRQLTGQTGEMPRQVRQLASQVRQMTIQT
jgi:hypothetical protein